MCPLLALLAMPSTALFGAPPGGAREWRLATADTVLVLAENEAGLAMASLRAADDGHEWLGSPLPEDVPTSVRVDGVESGLSWRYEGARLEDDTLVASYRSAEPALRFRVTWHAPGRRGPIERSAELINDSGREIEVLSIPSLRLGVLHAPEATDLWWIRRGGSNASTQGGTVTEPISEGLDRELVSSPTDGASPVPWAALQEGSARGLHVGWEFSGVGHVRVTCGSHDPRAVRVEVGLREDFATRLPAGETLAIPTAFVGCYTGTIDDGAYALHRFVLECLRPPAPRDYPDPTLAYNLYLDAGGNAAREADVLRCLEICANLGFETFVPDAMWFPHVGDWRWDPARFPRGLAPIAERVRARGLDLGLWLAWTNGGLSEAPNAANVRRTPTWFSGAYPADWQPGPFYGGNLCLADPEAEAWTTAETERVVRDFGLSYLKHDIGPIVTECIQTTHRHAGASDVGYWATLGYYRVMDGLLRAHPGLVLENCSGGGHIKDFGVMRRSHYTVTTDTLSNLPDRQSIWDSTFALPPLVLQAYTYNDAYPVEGDNPGPFLWRSAMMSAWQIDPTDATKWSEEERAEASREVAIYKRWIRPILADCVVRHVLPRPDGIRWDGLFLWSPPLGRGTLSVFRPASETAEETVRLEGLDPDGEYWVWAEDGSIEARKASGRELCAEGLTVRLPSRYSCDLIYVEEATGATPPWPAAPSAFALAPAEAIGGPFAVSASLAWGASEGATSYRLVVSERADLSEPLVDRSVLLPRFACEGLEPERGYRWSVLALGPGGRTRCEAEGRFVTPALEPTPGVRFVSTLEWLSATAGADNAVLRDRNYYGHIPSIGGRSYPRSLWTHAFPDETPADVVVDLAPLGAVEFRTEVGLDDESRGGSVQFEVLLDGEVVADGPVLRQGESRRFAVRLRGAKTLTLRVRNGGDGYACDHAVWGFARLLDAGAQDPVE